MCCVGCRKELKEWITSKKWWPNWIGFSLAILAAIVSIQYDSNVMKFSLWVSSDVNESFDTQTIVGILCLFPILFSLLATCDFATSEQSLSCNEILKKIGLHFRGFCVFYVISILCFLLGSQINMKQYGVGYALLSLIIGILMVNVPFICGKRTQSSIALFIAGATANGEFYIKCGLVLLATDLKTVVHVGVPGLIVSWLVPPLIILFMWNVAKKVLKFSAKSDGIVIALSSGAAICGVSAICAVAAVVELHSDETAMAVSILSFFTIIYMIAVPYIALYSNMNSIIAGAWIGGSVDGTGNVVAAVGILDDDDAYETATLIKMAQNILIGFVCLVVAILWSKDKTGGKAIATMETCRFRQVPIEKDGDSDTENLECEESSMSYHGAEEDEEDEADAGKTTKHNKCHFLWKKFPKFIIGFIVLSIVISSFIQPFAPEEYTQNFMSIIKQLSKWLFCLGFVGIGSNTIFSTLFKQIKDGKLLILYLVGQTVDTVITLLVAWLIVTYLM